MIKVTKVQSPEVMQVKFGKLDIGDAFTMDAKYKSIYIKVNSSEAVLFGDGVVDSGALLNPDDLVISVKYEMDIKFWI